MRQNPQSVRGSETMFRKVLRALFHQPGSLWRTSLPTLLFAAFCFVIVPYYTPLFFLRQVVILLQIKPFIPSYSCHSAQKQDYSPLQVHIKQNRDPETYSPGPCHYTAF